MAMCQKMEGLETGGISEVCIIIVSSQGQLSVGTVFGREVRGEAPETTWRIVTRSARDFS